MHTFNRIFPLPVIEETAVDIRSARGQKAAEAGGQWLKKEMKEDEVEEIPLSDAVT